MRVCAVRCGTRRGGVPCAVALVVQPSLTASPCCQRPRHQSTTTCPVSRKKAREEERRGIPISYKQYHCWLMPSPSASDGGGVRQHLRRGSSGVDEDAGGDAILPKMLSTAAAAGHGAQVAAQDQRALQAGADCLSSAAGTRPGTQTRVRARPPQITRRPCSAAGTRVASASTSAKPPEVLPAEQLGGARVLRTQLQRVPRRGDDADAHADAHAEALIWSSYKHV